jgi:acyl carrier protein
LTEREKKILGIVAQCSKKDGANPTPEESLFDSGILDSFGLPDLVGALEKEFEVTIPDSDLRPANFGSIRAIDSYLAKKRG